MSNITKLVGFTGAGGTGKTSTAKYIGCEIPSVVSDIRKVIYGQNSAFGDIKNISEYISFQCVIMTAQEHLEMISITNNSNNSLIIPVERSTIDYAAYMLRLKYTNPQEYEINKKYIEPYIDNCLKSAKDNYKGLVYFPIADFNLDNQNRNGKENNPESIKITDTCILELLKKIDLPVLKLSTTSSIEERAIKIIDYFK